MNQQVRVITDRFRYGDNVAPRSLFGLGSLGLGGLRGWDDLTPEEQRMLLPYVIAARVAQIASAGISGYHGYKRNRGSVGWALGWGALGLVFPIITPIVAVAQGYAKPARGSR